MKLVATVALSIVGACTPAPTVARPSNPAASPSASVVAPVAAPSSASTPTSTVTTGLAATGSVSGKSVELSCTVFGDRMIDPATALLWPSGLALISCGDQGFTLTLQLANVRLGVAPAGSRIQLAATSPLCGVSSQTPITSYGGARGAIEVTEWSAEERRVRGSFELAWQSGCGSSVGALKGSFVVTLNKHD